mgnify:CR=1 FL=1
MATDITLRNELAAAVKDKNTAQLELKKAQQELRRVQTSNSRKWWEARLKNVRANFKRSTSNPTRDQAVNLNWLKSTLLECDEALDNFVTATLDDFYVKEKPAPTKKTQAKECRLLATFLAHIEAGSIQYHDFTDAMTAKALTAGAVASNALATGGFGRTWTGQNEFFKKEREDLSKKRQNWAEARIKELGGWEKIFMALWGDDLVVRFRSCLELRSIAS